MEHSAPVYEENASVLGDGEEHKEAACQDVSLQVEKASHMKNAWIPHLRKRHMIHSDTLNYNVTSEAGVPVNALLRMIIFTAKECSSTVRRILILERGMRNDIQVKRTLMPETIELTTAAVLTVLTVLGSTSVAP